MKNQTLELSTNGSGQTPNAERDVQETQLRLQEVQNSIAAIKRQQADDAESGSPYSNELHDQRVRLECEAEALTTAVERLNKKVLRERLAGLLARYADLDPQSERALADVRAAIDKRESAYAAWLAADLEEKAAQSHLGQIDSEAVILAGQIRDFREKHGADLDAQAS